MIDKTMAQNKKMGGNEVEKKALISFFYPDYGLVIKAESKEEADAKLLEIINNK